jgi:flagellar transcriptional activator FlhD
MQGLRPWTLHPIEPMEPMHPMETCLKNEQLLAEIREANLTYLMLAQNLIRADRSEALYRLGLSQDAADLIANLSPAQVLKVSQGNMLLCRMRVDDDLVWNLLTNHGLSQDTGKAANHSANRLHASILMASNFAEAL